MPIAKIPPKTPVNPVQNPVIKSPVVRNEVVDSTYTPRKSLMTFVGGSVWVATYYSQILGAGSEPMPLQHDEQNTTQQYLRIRRTVIKVSTALNHNPEKEQGIMEVTGAGYLMPGITPNQGDMFVADMGDGRAGVFTISDIETMSIYNDAAYQITYEWTDWWDADIQKLFDDKVVQDTVYDLDFARTGKNPIIASEDFFNRDRMSGLEMSLIHHFFTTYYDNEYNTFMVPGQDHTTYDPYFTRFVDKLIDYEQRPRHARVNVFDESLKGNARPSTLWDMLVTQDPLMFKYVSKQMQVVPATYFRSATALYGAIAYAGIYGVVYPVTEDIFINTELAVPATPINPLLFSGIGINTTYVLSEAFYSQTPHMMSELERQVYNLITGLPISVEKVVDLVDAYFDSTGLVQYYAFPLLVCLCRTARYRL